MACPSLKTSFPAAYRFVLCLLAGSFLGLLAGGTALGQAGAFPPNAPSYSKGSSSTPGSGSSSGASVNPNLFNGSVPEGKATAEVLPLSFKEAIDRGLRNNLGVLVQGDNVLNARGEKWKELSTSTAQRYNSHDAERGAD